MWWIRSWKCGRMLRAWAEGREIPHCADSVRNDGDFYGEARHWERGRPKTHPRKTRMGHPTAGQGVHEVKKERFLTARTAFGMTYGAWFARRGRFGFRF